MLQMKVFYQVPISGTLESKAESRKNDQHRQDSGYFIAKRTEKRFISVFFDFFESTSD